jgi:hypothetical protein
MAVLALITLPGDPDELLKLYDQHDGETRHLPTTGLVSHTVARTPHGLTMADVWESPELLERYMAEPEFQAALDRAGMPEPTVEVYAVDRQRDPAG